MEVNNMADKPIKTFRAGGVSVSIFRNTNKTKDGKEFTVDSITPQRTYMEGEEYKHTTTMKVNDLPKLAMLSQKAYEFLTTKEE